MNLNHFRRPLFWTFVVGFFCTSGLVLFLAFGYRFNFERGIFVYSGSITVKSIPSTLSIKIDDEVVSPARMGFLNNSFHIAGLMPGTHSVEVAAPGYKPWAKKAVIGSGVSTEFWNVILVEEKYDETPLVGTENTVKVFPDSRNRLLALVKEVSGETVVVVIDRDTGSSEQVFSSELYTFDKTNTDGLSWSPDRRRLIIPLLEKNGGKKVFMAVNRETGETTRLSDLFTASSFESALWDENEKYTVVFIADKNLYRVDLASNTATELLAENVRAFDLSGNYIYIARLEDGMVLRMNGRSGDNLEQVSLSPPVGLENSPATLSVYDENRFALLEKGETGALFFYNKGDKENYGFQKLADHVSGIEYSNDGKKLLFWNENEMNAYFTRAWEVEPIRAENSKAQIARFSDKIENVEWAEDYEHVLFSQGGTVKMIELDSRDRRVLTDILTLPEKPSQIFPLFGDNLLYFVLPDTGLSSIVFPQPQTLFGQ